MHTEQVRYLCTREFQSSTHESVHTLLKDTVSRLGLLAHFDINETSIRGKEHGSEVIYKGLRINADEIKSMEGLDGVWVEESEKTSAASMRILRPTIRKPGSELIFSWNPELDDSPMHEMVSDPPRDSVIIDANWSTNPYFTAELELERLECLEKDPKNYEWIWDGKVKSAVDGAIFADELAEAFAQHRVTRCAPLAGIPVHTFWDLGQSDNTAIWFIQIVGLEYRVIAYYQSSGVKMAHYIAKLEEYRARLNIIYGSHYLPHDAEHEQLAAQSTIKQQMQTAIDNNSSLGKQVLIVPRIAHKALGIEAARKIFPQCIFDKTETKDGIQCLKHYAYKKDDKNNKTSKEPKHDNYSHGADAFMQFAQHHKSGIVMPQVKSIMMGR